MFFNSGVLTEDAPSLLWRELHRENDAELGFVRSSCGRRLPGFFQGKFLAHGADAGHSAKRQVCLESGECRRPA